MATYERNADTLVNAAPGGDTVRTAIVTRLSEGINDLYTVANTIDGQITGFTPATDLAADDGSALVGFLQAGTGAVARTLQDKGRDFISVKDFGAVGDGTTDDTAAIQAAIDASVGRLIFFPKGEYKVASTLAISTRGNRLVGEFQGRASLNGTQITFYGSGPLFEIGTDDGLAWNAANYDGLQDQMFENLHMVHGDPDTALTCLPAQNYADGTYGILDWRGGGLRIVNCGFERFEYNFLGVQSDLNIFSNITSLYSKHGIYIGPRSDQFALDWLYAFYCDNALVIDGAQGLRFENINIVGCGSDTDHAILIKQGSSNITFESPWLEHLQGYIGVDQIAFFGIGTEAGYGSNTGTVKNVNINTPLYYTTISGSQYHTKYIVEMGKAVGVHLVRPAMPIGSAINVDQFIAFQSVTAYTNATSSIFFHGDYNDTTKIYVNNGTGTPEIGYFTFGSLNVQFGTGNGRLLLNAPGASAGANSMLIGQELTPGAMFFKALTYPATGQSTRFSLRRSWQNNYGSMPTTGTWESGDIAWNTSATENGGTGSKYLILGWYRMTSGSNHVLNTDWKEMRVLTGA